MKLYRVEVTDENGNWYVSSRHQNEDHAIINAQVKLQDCKDARVIFEGRIVWPQ